MRAAAAARARTRAPTQGSLWRRPQAQAATAAPITRTTAARAAHAGSGSDQGAQKETGRGSRKIGGTATAAVRARPSQTRNQERDGSMRAPQAGEDETLTRIGYAAGPGTS